MPKVTKKRSHNFARNEQNLLLTLIKKYKDVIECKKSGHVTWSDKQATWKKLQEEFNAQNNGEYRDVETLKQKYQNLKKTAKQKFSANRRNLIQTGGGSCKVIEIDEIDQSVKDLLGDQIQGQPSVCDSDLTDQNEVPHNNIRQEFEEQFAHEESITNQNDNDVHTEVSESNSSMAEQEITARDKQEPLVRPSSSKNWGKYSSSMLKESNKHDKLKTNKQRGKLAFKKNINEKLISRKIFFLDMQKELLLKEHKFKMKILSYEYLIKKKQAQALGINVNDSSDDEQI